MERLREHWEEANARVLSRKNTLEDMLLECRQYDEMRAEFERWLTQVEEDVEAQRHVGQGPEILGKQTEEQKVGMASNNCRGRTPYFVFL